MPKLNRWLVATIIEDMKEFIAVGNEMCSWIGKCEYFSWRYPTRTARNVNAMSIVERRKGSAGEMYILLLEMAYDRMHFVLRLVVDFMDSYPFIEEFLEKESHVKRPKSMSMANVIRTLWQRLKLIPETVTRNMIKTEHLKTPVFAGQKSLGCQASGSLSRCESCSCASKTVTDLTNVISVALQKDNLSSAIVAERDLICADRLMEKTQWSVMTKLADAIDADIKTLLDATATIRAKSEADFKEHEKCPQSLTAELKKRKIERSSLEMKITETMDRLRAVDGELHKLKDDRTKLIEENRALTECLREAKEKSSNYEILLKSCLRQTADMAESKVALENAVEYLREEVGTARRTSIAEIETLRKSLAHLRSEKVLREKQRHEEIDILEENHAEVVKNLEEHISRLSASGLKSIERFSSIEAEVQTEEEIKIGYEIEAEMPAPKGDPEIDMAEQLASNKNAIDKLTRQNERLFKTLTRLREHRRISVNPRDTAISE